MIAEASARGTPVIALARGSAPELIDDGVTGVLGADEEALVAAVPRAERLFARDRIARQHLAVYAALVAGTDPVAAVAGASDADAPAGTPAG